MQPHHIRFGRRHRTNDSDHQSPVKNTKRQIPYPHRRPYLFADLPIIDIYTGGTQRLRINSSGASVTGTVTQSTAKTKQFTGQYDGRETTTITLGSLGFKPQALFCFFSVNSANKMSVGWAGRDAGQQVLLDYSGQASGWESSTSYFARLAFGQAKFSNLSITSWNDNSVVINKNVNLSGASSTCAYKIIVMG